MEASCPAHWDVIEKQLADAIANALFEVRTIVNSYDLVNFCREHCEAPSTAVKGYWATISLSWPHLEVEIFADRFELYQFRENGTEISEFDRDAAEPLPTPLIDALLRALTSPPCAR